MRARIRILQRRVAPDLQLPLQLVRVFNCHGLCSLMYYSERRNDGPPPKRDPVEPPLSACLIEQEDVRGRAFRTFESGAATM